MKYKVKLFPNAVLDSIGRRSMVFSVSISSGWELLILNESSFRVQYEAFTFNVVNGLKIESLKLENTALL